MEGEWREKRYDDNITLIIDTGHVMIVAANPSIHHLKTDEVQNINGTDMDTTWVRVVDASSNHRKDDSRGCEGCFKNGLGSGYVNFIHVCALLLNNHE